MKTIIFVFGGRREHIELQLPYIRRILASHSQTEYHIWDLARHDADHRWLQTIKGDRITVRTDFYGHGTSGFNEVLKHYTADEYEDCLFVKLDDDVVFLDADRFDAFIAAIDANRHGIISAKVINNGACTPLEPALYDKLREIPYEVRYRGVYRPQAESLPLSQVHRSRTFAQACHEYFFRNWRQLCRQPIELVPTKDWLSINVIGYDWAMGCNIWGLLGRQYFRTDYDEIGTTNVPEEITEGNLGDEGVVNLLPRAILNGFIACHHSFGPQAARLTNALSFDWHNKYANVSAHYCASEPAQAVGQFVEATPRSD